MLLLATVLAAQTAGISPLVTLTSIRDGCRTSGTCEGRHAIIFVHGIFGNAATFINTDVVPSFYWPEHVPRRLAGAEIDVFQVEYQTHLFSWSDQHPVDKPSGL